MFFLGLWIMEFRISIIILALDNNIKSDEANNSIIRWPKKGEIRIETDNIRYAVIIDWVEFKTLKPKILFLGKLTFICFLIFKLVAHFKLNKSTFDWNRTNYKNYQHYSSQI